MIFKKSVFLRFFVVFISFLLMGITLFAKKPALKVVLYPMPPWRIEKNGKLFGAEINFLREVAKRGGFELKIINVPFSRALLLLKEGRADLSMGFLKTKDRENFLLYCFPAYKRYSDKAFYSLRRRNLKIKSINDLVGKTVGVTQGAIYFKRFDDEYKIIKDAVAGKKQNFTKLLLGRIDVLIADESFADYYIKKHKLKNFIKKASYAYRSLNPSYVVFSFRSIYAKKLYPIISSMILKGESDAIFYRYFKKHKIKIPHYR